ncbi:MAG: putative N-cysteinyl-D-myo-inosityl-2-amino-2-deoxy-alpha-D-glucopyranoside acetyltransferase [Actinomycetia bacterium]|nr:putative N-cysteinyl-D-myo-inosityl-2-amino-2-deoxy-alpha-D-glucopyranoside acetyltransferase [Actinomycetes bacterium]
MSIDVAPAVDAASTQDRTIIEALDRSSRTATGHEALNEAVWIDLDDPQPGSAGFFASDGDRRIGYAHVARLDNDASDTWTLGVAIDPSAPLDATATALIDAAVKHVARSGGGTLVFWRFSPDEAEDSRIRALGFTVARELFQMRVPLPLAETAEWPAGVAVRIFEPGRDDAEWLAVNNRAFAGHAEQGAWTQATLQRRLAEPWFDPSLFLLAVDEQGVVGFNWGKLHPPTDDDPELGEIFVIGVDDRGRGLGLGRPLAIAGLDLMARRGATMGMLYSAADNEPALRLYRSLGFTVYRVDRAYERTIEPK